MELPNTQFEAEVGDFLGLICFSQQTEHQDWILQTQKKFSPLMKVILENSPLSSVYFYLYLTV